MDQTSKGSPSPPGSATPESLSWAGLPSMESAFELDVRYAIPYLCSSPCTVPHGMEGEKGDFRNVVVFPILDQDFYLHKGRIVHDREEGEVHDHTVELRVEEEERTSLLERIGWGRCHGEEKDLVGRRKGRRMEDRPLDRLAEVHRDHLVGEEVYHRSYTEMAIGIDAANEICRIA